MYYSLIVMVENVSWLEQQSSVHSKRQIINSAYDNI